MSTRVLDDIVRHLHAGYPLEACGFLSGPEGAWRTPDSVDVIAFHPMDNTAESAVYYTIDPLAQMALEDTLDDTGHEIVGVVHSHTHSEPFPSPTDVDTAVSENWHYVIVSFKREAPEVRSYRIADQLVREEPVVIIND